jgi:hypothetical protein
LRASTKSSETLALQEALTDANCKSYSDIERIGPGVSFSDCSREAGQNISTFTGLELPLQGTLKEKHCCGLGEVGKICDSADSILPLILRCIFGIYLLSTV